MPQGGHFAAFEEPQILAEDIISFVNKIGKEQEVHESGPFVLRQLLKFIDAFKISVTNSVIETARTIPDVPVVVEDPNANTVPKDQTKDPIQDRIVELDAAMKQRNEKKQNEKERKEQTLDEQYIVEEILKKIPAQRDDDIDEDDIKEMIDREKKKKRKSNKEKEKSKHKKSKHRNND